jgi:MFS family permease
MAPDERKHLTSYLGSRLAGTAGFQVQSVAVGWQVYSLTGDPMDLGWVGLAQFLPLMLLSLYAGQVADRFDRKRIVIVCRLGFAAGSVALAALSLSSAPAVEPIWVVLVWLGSTRAFVGPATSALLPGLVEESRLPRAIAMSSTTFQVAVIVGPAVGGFVYAAGGPVAAYLAAAGLELVAAAQLAGIRKRFPRPDTLRESGLPLLLSGVRYVFANKVLLGAISLDLFAVLLGGAVALMPIYARDILDVGTTGLGLLRAAPAVGAAVVAIAFAVRPLERRAGRWMLLAVALFGVATIVFGLSESFGLSLAALAVLGGADMVSVVIRQSLIQLRTPDEMRGRVTGVNYIFIGASNELGEFESGLTAAWLGTVPAVVIGGVGTLLVTVAAAVLFPALRREDRLA